MTNNDEYTDPNKINRKTKYLRGFKVAHLNIRSLIKHIDQFRYFLKEKQFDIICLGETFLDETINDHEVNIEGCVIVRRDKNRNGGGVAIYVRNSINWVIRAEFDTEDLETITVGISKPKSKPFLINCVYRPPDSTLELLNTYEKLIEKLDSEDKKTILIGDFNCDWTGVKSGKVKLQTNKLYEITQTFQFKQMIDQPTRITNNSEIIIDLAFTNKPELIIRSGVIHIRTSDHSFILIQRKISIPRPEPKLNRKRQFKRYNINAFISDLTACLVNLTSTVQDSNDMWSDWKDRFLFVADIHAPQETRKVRSINPPWITKRIRQTTRHRDYLRKKLFSQNLNNIMTLIKRSEMS